MVQFEAVLCRSVCVGLHCIHWKVFLIFSSRHSHILKNKNIRNSNCQLSDMLSKHKTMYLSFKIQSQYSVCITMCLYFSGQSVCDTFISTYWPLLKLQFISCTEGRFKRMCITLCSTEKILTPHCSLFVSAETKSSSSSTLWKSLFYLSVSNSIPLLCLLIKVIQTPCASKVHEKLNSQSAGNYSL